MNVQITSEECQAISAVAGNRVFLDVLTRERDAAMRYVISATEPALFFRAQGRITAINDLLELLTKQGK